MVKKKSVKKTSVKNKHAKAADKRKAVKNVARRGAKRAPVKSWHPKIVPIRDPNAKDIIDMDQHTVKTTAPEVHVLGHDPKTAHETFTRSEGGAQMNYEFDTVKITERAGFTGWFNKYSPVVITLGIGLITYLYLLFYMFYPAAIAVGKYIPFVIVIIFLFVIAGILLFLGLRSELLFVRILSFIFVFVVFTFLLLFILVSYALKNKMV